ncbi:hypothetical protein CC79DRAFT_1337637 [Sarocladium strictum]
MVAAGWSVVCWCAGALLALGANVAASCYWERAGVVCGVNETCWVCTFWEVVATG